MLAMEASTRLGQFGYTEGPGNRPGRFSNLAIASVYVLSRMARDADAGRLTAEAAR